MVSGLSLRVIELIPSFSSLIGPPGGSWLQEVHPAARRLRGRLWDAEEVPRAGTQTGSLPTEQRTNVGAGRQHTMSLLTNHSSWLHPLLVPRRETYKSTDWDFLEKTVKCSNMEKNLWIKRFKVTCVVSQYLTEGAHRKFPSEWVF